MTHRFCIVWGIIAVCMTFSGCGSDPRQSLDTGGGPEPSLNDLGSSGPADPADAPAGSAKRVVVRFRKGTGAYKSAAVMKGQGDQVERIIPQLEAHVISVPEGQSAEDVIARYKNHPLVEFVEEDEALELALVPNDPVYDGTWPQWHLPHIGMEQAWDITTGSPDVIIAILDTGVGPHPELSPKLVPGWNFTEENSDTSDPMGHGTGVAGVAAAISNEGAGVASIAWDCPIMPFRVVRPDAPGMGSSTRIADALVLAADRGARVANLSFARAASSGNYIIEDAERYFFESGGVVTGGAGNDGTFDDRPDNPYALNVNATDQNDQLPLMYALGNSLDLSAPGDRIRTVSPSGSEFSSASGTSFSAPIVAGVAALMFSANPSLSPQEVQQILKDTAKDLGTPGWDTTFGWGRVDAARAIQAARDYQGSSDTTAPFVHIEEPLPLELVRGTINVAATASDDTAVSRVDLYCDETFVSSDTVAPHDWPVDTTTLPDGAHTFEAVAFDSAGNSARSDPVEVTVANAECSVAADCDDADACTADECVNGECRSAALDCNDNDVCTTDSCDPTTGCSHVAVNCDDGDATTADTCDATTGCVHTPLDCDDGNACTFDGFDASGLCVHSQVDCDDGNACTTETCNPYVGCVVASVSCNDGDPCTTDSCDTRSGCVYEPVRCASGQTCLDGTCQSTACDLDGVCDAGEDCSTCPGDCPAGGGSVCGNGLCEAGNGEDCLTCPSDCAGKQEGKPDNRFCCGAGGGEKPVGCGDGRCNSSGFACVSPAVSPSCCGDGVCEGVESGCNCAIDCGNADGAELPGSTCRDGLDNDCDGAADCNDPDCEGATPCPTCLPTGAPCSGDSDCCSQKCRGGGKGGLTCNG